MSEPVKHHPFYTLLIEKTSRGRIIWRAVTNSNKSFVTTVGAFRILVMEFDWITAGTRIQVNEGDLYVASLNIGGHELVDLIRKDNCTVMWGDALDRTVTPIVEDL
jgi:hypothetical protein